MGDVIHNLPVASDIRSAIPEAEIDWAVEDAFAEIPALHPAINDVLPISMRRWRKRPISVDTWREISITRRLFAGRRYDVVLDTQGLVKSALIALCAHGERRGYARDTAREPLASLFYDKRYSIGWTRHAVERGRLLAAAALGYPLPASLDYGIRAPALSLSWLGASRYAVLLHATSRDDKRWADDRWIALAARLREAQLTAVLPWGSDAELDRSKKLARAMKDAIVPPRMTLREASALFVRAALVVGVDTGLTHLAAALGAPVAALYCATDPGLTGVYAGANAVNLGGEHGPPSVEQVHTAALHLLDAG
jgi:heptosyltransferase-1